jgi:V/A-type H+-transporting ATPase subunit I
MKARMKKISLLLYHAEKDDFLANLQDLGLLHLEVDERVLDEKMDALLGKKEKLAKALEVLNESVKTSEKTTDPVTEIESLAEEILDHQAKKDELKLTAENLQKEKTQLIPWGQFDWSKIERIADAGIHVRFYYTNKKQFEKTDLGDLAYAVVAERKGNVYLMFLETADSPDLPFEIVSLPKRSLADIERMQGEIQAQILDLDQEIGSKTRYAASLEKEIIKIEDEIFYEQARGSGEGIVDNKIQIVEGWIPADDEVKIITYLQENNIAFSVKEPDPYDQPPIILKNRKYPKIFESITNIFELPNYRELDLTPVIAVFYPVFFAYCLGDSGYGLVFLLVFGYGLRTFLKDNKPFALLGMMLGLFTMIIGILKAGTLFGIQITQQRDIPFFDFFSKFVIIPEMSDTPFNAFNVALILGVIQVVIGVISAIIRSWIYESFEASLSSFGKLFIIVGTIVLFLGAAQGVAVFEPYLGIAKIVLFLGIALVLLFNNIRVPILKRIGRGVLPLYFIFTGLLGDVLSYIRLFALGISSGILGLVVNNIGQQMMGESILGIIIGIIFLIFGHTLNLLISGLGSFVHPLRLTFVEFYNNAGFQGGGKPFRPFRKESLSNLK